MAAPYNPPKKGEDFIVHIGLRDMLNRGQLKSDPTIATGDFKVRKDDGALADIATLPAFSGKVGKLVLSATEMTADVVTVVGSDPDGEWGDFFLSIPTTA